MNTMIKLSSSLVSDARRLAAINFRSTAKQIEYWAHLGRTIEENPDMPLDFIKGCLESKSEMDNGDVSEIEFSKGGE